MCTPFWLDDPLSALENIKSIIPKANQCIDERLNGLSLFVIIFTIILAAAGSQYYWIFGVVGLTIVILLKLFWFKGRRGKASLDEYMLGHDNYDNSEVSQSVYQTEELDEQRYYEPVFEDDLQLIPALNNNGDTWEEIKENVGDQISHARMPYASSGCMGPGFGNLSEDNQNCYY